MVDTVSQSGDAAGIEVPAVLFDSLDARQIVELFVTINAKHTRLNPSHIISLAGRKLYPDPNQALAHDIIRSLNEDDTSPLAGEIKMLGTGRGRVSQAPLAEEIVDFFETVEKVGGGSKINSTTYVEGPVTAIELQNGQSVITINGGKVPVSSVIGVSLVDSDTNNTAGQTPAAAA